MYTNTQKLSSLWYDVRGIGSQARLSRMKKAEIVGTAQDRRELSMGLSRPACAALLTLSLLGGGCTTVWVQERRLAPTGLAPQDAIALILTSPLGNEQLSGIENQVTGCIRDALGQTHPDLRIVPSDEFRKSVFSDLTIEKISPGNFSWESLLRDAVFYGRVASLGLRYLINVNVEERTRLSDFEWNAATNVLGGPGPLLHWTRESSTLMQAIVVDARHRRVAGGVQAFATGKSGAGVKLIMFPIPLPIPYATVSFPISVACQGLGEGLAKFLTAESPEEAQAAKERENQAVIP